MTPVEIDRVGREAGGANDRVEVDADAATIAWWRRTRFSASGIAVPLGSLAIAVIACLLWQLASSLTFVIASPSETLASLVDNIGDPKYRRDLGVTVRSIGCAFAIGVAGGALLGLLLGSAPRLRRVVAPLIEAVYSVPKIILYPLILPILQIGATSQIFMGVIHAIFPMMVMVSAAVAQIPSIHRRLGRSLDASPLRVFWHITLPATRRPFLTGMRLAVSLATIGVILAEFFSTIEGLGRSMKQAYQFGQYPELMSTVLLLLTVSFAASFLIWTIERRLPEA